MELEAFDNEYSFQDYDKYLIRGGVGFQINEKIDPAEISKKYPNLTIVYHYTIVHKDIEGWSEWVNGKMVDNDEYNTEEDEEEQILVWIGGKVVLLAAL